MNEQLGYKNNKIAYLGGGMLTKGEQLLRDVEQKDLEKIGVEMYSPKNNKSINDKSKVSNDGLAERIVKADTDAIVESDVFILDVHSSTQGCLVELGQSKGMKDFALMVNELLNESEIDELKLNNIKQLVDKFLSKKYYPHCEDVRRFKGAGKGEESTYGDRRSFSHNAYVYGVVLDLSDHPEGFYEWNEILDELKELNNDK